MNPLLKLLAALSRALHHAGAAHAANNPLQTKGAIQAADTILTKAIDEALAAQQHRSMLYGTPFSQN